MGASGGVPVDIKLHRKSGLLELFYGDGNHLALNAEFLRVYSPSAEVRGHGVGQEVLQTGKKNVKFTGAEVVGNYAIKLIFDDGHDSGLYTWEYLYDLGVNHVDYWQNYLDRLSQVGALRDPDVRPINILL
ncbi:MAG: DUF971 domain-containing protein [Endozoicomonadaceae bacterium]|nr:DUF971 domain-containing protein [Endozoicomonadaceae bacterium]